MGSMAKTYTNDIHHEWVEVFAAWPIGLEVELGDYGYLEDGIFQRMGNISDKGISGETGENDNDAAIEYKSSDEVSIVLRAKGSADASGLVQAKASLEMSFSGKHAVFFKAAGGKWHTFKSPDEVGQQILSLYHAGDWKREFVVVTNLLKAGATTVLVSSGSSASISIEAKADKIEAIDLVDADVGLQIKSESNLGLKVIAEKGMTPIFGLMKIHRLSVFDLGLITIGYFWGPKK